MKNKRTLTIVLVLAIVLIAILVLSPTKSSAFVTLDNFEGKITIHKSLSCGCCGLYSDYFKSKTKVDLIIRNSVDLSSIKEQYEIPLSMESCHTTIIGNYFVEGHIPLEAIEKLLTEQPDIDGIAMPGMPSGSPGMPGRKTRDFVIYSVKGGQISEFMRI